MATGVGVNDFVKGIDFTGVSPITGADLNVLVDSATPEDDRSINLWTEDTALGVPAVPDPGATTKLRRYLWIRKPHSTATVLTPKVYAWNQDATSDATYLKWIEISADLATLQAEIDALDTDMTVLTGTVNGYAASIVTANNLAKAAQDDADDANTTANGLSGQIAAAERAAQDAATAASTAKARADTAYTLADSEKAITDILTPGAAGQQIRTNDAANAVEWFSPSSRYARFSEKQATTVDGTAYTGAGEHSVIFNTTDTDSDFATLGSSGLITLAIGQYIIRGSILVYNAGGLSGQVYLKTSAGASLIVGQSMKNSSVTDANLVSFVGGYLNVTAATVIKVTVSISATCSGGKAGSRGTDEVYSVLEITKL